ncbi:cellulose-binding protein [Streptomyces sp. NBC_00554]|uniref:cellulose-binding protein n=1 Tax=Streptomyces sp. NBC_00554 TaxID=2903661 RepID=UPI00352CB778|nr:cellulose-binding protein [Streptomyces sp. NBC_00554]
MSSASEPPYGFMAVRGRGYRPEQVDAYAAALSRYRDAAWERAARLTVLAREMEAEAERLREVVATLAPQTYETLGEGARQIFALGEEEAASVRDTARLEVQRVVDEAEAAGQRVREAAAAYADEVRGEAEERARQRLLAARAEADDMRISARRDVKENRGEALAALREVRQRTEGLLAEQEKEHAERWEEAGRAAAEREGALDAQHVERVACAEAALSEAKRAFAEAEESARHGQEDAGARAAEVLAEAQVREDRIARETERVLREHGERWDDVRAHMDHVRTSLTTLTGRAPAE